jgi:hypothetical protein
MPAGETSTSSDSPLMPRGLQNAKELGARIRTKEFKDFDVSSIVSAPEPWAKLTASLISGIPVEDITVWPELREPYIDSKRRELVNGLRKGEVPDIGIEAAEAVLTQPRPEGIWIAGGTVIAGLQKVLGISRPNARPYASLLVDFGEITRMDIPERGLRR